MTSAAPLCLGLEIGGTRLKGGMIDARGQAVAREFTPARPGQDLRAFEQQLDELVEKLTATAGRSAAAIGVSITGPVDPKVGCVLLPGKIRGLDRHKTIPYLKRRWKLPAVGDNDGRLACFAEWRAGAGRGVDNLVVFTLGTGIGSGVVLDGRLLTDRFLQRGTQCGHVVIEVGGPRCLTGAHGTGESLASVTALVQDVRGALARGLDSSLLGRPAHEVSFPDIAAAVRRGDPVVEEIFARWLDRFAAVMLNAFYAYAPDLILLAGGPMKAADLLVAPLARRLNDTAFRVPPKRRIRVRAAMLGEDAGWMGAALFAQEQFAAPARV